MEDLLHLNTGSYLECSLQPVVVFSILDHYIRRNENQDRVIGTLMGVVEDDVVEIRNCFPVPHSEVGDEYGMDETYHQNMLAMHKQVYPKEVIVGWYATGKAFTDSSVFIHNFYKDEMGTQPPVHLLVDTNLSDSRLAVQTFLGNSVAFGDVSVGMQFSSVPVRIVSFEAERIAVESILKGRIANPVVQLTTDIQNIESSVNKLGELLDQLIQYVDKVKDGKTKAPASFGRYIADAVASLPRIDAETLEQNFNSSVQDLLMVLYLSNLTRTQLALSERLLMEKPTNPTPSAAAAAASSESK